MPHPLHRQTRRRPRRDALLKAAVEVVAEQGVAGVTHRAVTERAGVPLATASYYFSSIGELISEALREFVRERVRKMSEPLHLDHGGREQHDEGGDQSPTPLDVGAQLVTLFRDSSELQRLAFFEVLVNSARSAELAESARHALNSYIDTTRSALRSLGAPDDVGNARALVALGLGYGLLHVAEPDADDADEFLHGLRDLFVGQELAHTDPERVARRTGERD